MGMTISGGGYGIGKYMHTEKYVLFQSNCRHVSDSLGMKRTRRCWTAGDHIAYTTFGAMEI
jgi:hypothetical protein